MDRNSDIFLEIKWTINDIQELLKANNCDYSDEAIENFFKNFCKHLPKVITVACWRRHPVLIWGSGCCRPMPYHLAIAPKLERITRLELATSTLARWRSTR